jgi:hypothetical protein
VLVKTAGDPSRENLWLVEHGALAIPVAGFGLF